MGHDHHFLSRLDRVDLAHAEMALGLYRDHELVRECLRASSAPRDAPRVAFSLDDPVEGPFVIVAQDGGFVTCLGRGMHARHPVIPRRELEMIAKHIGRLREAMNLFEHDSAQKSMLTRVVRRGELLFSEDIAELRAVLPLIENHVMTSVIDLGQALTRALPRIRREVKRKGARSRAQVAQYSRLSWRYRTHMVVAGLASERLRMSVLEKGWSYSLTQPAMRVELRFLVVAGGWLTAQFGPDAVEAVVARMRKWGDVWSQLDGVVGLCCIAAKHPEQRERVRHVFEHEIDFLSEELGVLLEVGATSLALDEQGALETALVKDAQKSLFDAQIDVGFKPERAEDIPPETALTWMFQVSSNVVQSHHNFVSCVLHAMAAAKRDAEALCLPRRYSDYHEAFLAPLVARELLSDLRREAAIPKPETAKPTPGRNDPCSCGSGRKYKRCCGAAG